MTDHAKLAALIARDLSAGLCDPQTFATCVELMRAVAVKVTGHDCEVISR